MRCTSRDCVQTPTDIAGNKEDIQRGQKRRSHKPCCDSFFSRTQDRVVSGFCSCNPLIHLSSEGYSKSTKTLLTCQISAVFFLSLISPDIPVRRTLWCLCSCFPGSRRTDTHSPKISIDHPLTRTYICFIPYNGGVTLLF
jgi:hypothetical protein